ncbi:hypothetical protein [Vibrio maritimus]|uniref:hypothetical protein n=1 Tax=Vibrio maritimus TaxID=990268 RepID=UPI003735991C
MDYVYVENIYDDEYRIAPPMHTKLTEGDIPEEEFEIREVLECWYEVGFVPFIDAQNTKVNFWEQVSNFKRLTQTLAVLIRCRAYQSALRRITSQWRKDSLECQYLHYLLEKQTA